MVVPQEYLFMHIVTREVIIGTTQDLPDYVPHIKQLYSLDHTSEYINLGAITFTDDNITLFGNRRIMVERGIKSQIMEDTMHFTIEEESKEESIFDRVCRFFRELI